MCSSARVHARAHELRHNALVVGVKLTADEKADLVAFMRQL
jgi:hypothetical protein